jgi:single-stranded-DNA-specific exonuclease
MTVIDILLKKRGLITKKEQAEFLDPIKPDKITLDQIDLQSAAIVKAIKRLTSAYKNQELIYIYGDYDTDGVSSTAILWETLNALDFQVLPFIPSRNDPVRGLSPLGIDLIIKQAKTKPGLIITVDNGITAFKGCQYAEKLGIEVIITDHHLPKHKNNRPFFPKALAIIHTTKLAGAGVAWFFSREVLRHLRGDPPAGGLDLAALGTIADMVPLLNANRSLAKFGLDKIRLSQRPGLIALAKTANLDLKNLNDYQVSYVLAPRLNALGRLEHALDALRLLCTTDLHRAERLAVHLNQTNQLRQDKTQTMFLDAKEKFLKQSSDQPLIFVASKTYHEGVVGLVAGKLMEEFNRPAVVVALGKNYSKASGRSLKGFNILKAIRSLEPYLLEHGGHELAAGFTIDNKNIKIVAQKLLKLAKKSLLNKELEPAVEVDCELNFNQINWQLFNALEKFKPFGFANPQPLFATKQVKLLTFRSVGQDNKHLKLSLRGDSLQVDGIAFSLGHLAQKLTPGQLIDIVYTIEANDWNNQKTLQLKIKEINR